jgi:DNA modification methylase
MLGSNKESVLKVISKYQDNIKEICIWAKTASPPASSERCLSNQYEFILCLSKYDRKGKQFVRAFFDNRSGGQENIANCLIRNMQKDNKCPEHKATFPEWLPEFFIKLFSKEGDLVLDPFMGTGTTAYVAKQMQRRFIGFDLSEHYCNFARNRLNQLNIFGFSNPQNKQPSFAVNQKRLDF